MTTISNARQRWEQTDVNALLSRAVTELGPVSPTEAGTSPRGVLGVATTAKANPIGLGGGIPDPDALPADDLRAALDHVLATAAAGALRYGGVLGGDELRSVLAERQSRIEGLRLTTDHFLVTNGSSGAIDLICDAFLTPGDVVLAENPAFAGTLRTIRGHLCEVVGVPIGDGSGFAARVGETLERLAAQGQRAKLLYTVPDYSNPTGLVMTTEERRALLEVCARHQVFVLEDAAYTEIYFDTSPPPSLYALAEGYGVLRCGSFSKVIATGLRVGWVQAQPGLIDALSRVRFDMGGSPLVHRALAEYVGTGKVEPHAARMRALYAEKCAALAASLEEHCTPFLRFDRPAGGYFLWAECLGAPAARITADAAADGLLFAPGSAFYLHPGEDTTHIRLAFSFATLDEMREVGPRLRAVFRRAGAAG